MTGDGKAFYLSGSGSSGGGGGGDLDAFPFFPCFPLHQQSLGGLSSGGGNESEDLDPFGFSNHQAVAAFPAGWLGDRIGHVRVLVGGYLVGMVTMAGFAALILSGSSSLIAWAGLFALAGV